MTREQFLAKYRSDPEFRLKRLYALRWKRARQGLFPRDKPYEVDIAQARKEIEASK